MKKIKLISAIIFLFIVTIFSSCSDEDDVAVNNSVDPTPVINTVNTGTWRITFYQDSGVDETSDFSGYNFSFGAGNILSATNGTNTYTGTWSVTSDNSNDDSPSNDLDFNIAFSAPANFTELTEDWNVISYTATRIQLIHVSGGGGGTDYITFEKN
ncbi:hypothetical protein G6N05_09330 [Flavobacterium sp. F372]|uniref:Lipocalin-like domain-containing protein n=1 Tax=Flavobacterium bernardetii TaxID=2813823 RepID=A0ABR7IXZ5_9FLAO|nr:hypothetical protein [Flavobacterium bernardetii]MBC5834659.1 hypothetical protein [Flavobacterium bernardetii]NHF70307.1 hypothetical protein [Flavobacterium bernardetii]